MNRNSRVNPGGDATPVIGNDRPVTLNFLKNKKLPVLEASSTILDANLAILKSRNQNSLQPRAKNFEDLTEEDKRLLLLDLQEVFDIEPLDSLLP